MGQTKNYLLLGSLILFGMFEPNIARADEKWSTEEYDVIYQQDRNQTAIWTYGDENKITGTIFIDGLAGVSENRSSYDGYWVQESSSMRCDTYREGTDGKPTYYWGQFKVEFIDPDFPSRWKATFGLCDREPSITLNGTPI